MIMIVVSIFVDTINIELYKKVLLLFDCIYKFILN